MTLARTLEKLCEEVVEAALSVPGILKTEISRADDHVPTLCRALVALSTSERNQLDGILLLIRSASNEHAANILRQSAVRHVAPLLDILSGGNTSKRAAMFLSVVAGFQLMRRVIALPALNGNAPDTLTEQLQSLFECLLIDKDASMCPHPPQKSEGQQP